jgi:predicted ATPase
LPDGGEAEAVLTADWNAERVERMLRYPRLRDRSIFVGNADDLVGDALGPGLPTVREWAEQQYLFPATSPTCGATWPPATSRWCRAG